MKKLMIAAAVAAVAGATFAGSWGQVYTATITVKTTVCAKGKVSNGYLTKITDPGTGLSYSKGDLISYRKQGSRTIQGILWGCGCDDVFSGTWAQNTLGYWSGNVFWDKKTGAYVAQTGDTNPWDDTTLAFPIMHRIGARATEVEMLWTLTVDPSADEAAAGATPTVLTMAGFGTITDKNLDTNGDDCDSVIASARGNVAGTLPAPYGSESACAYCVGGVACAPWTYCSCTAAYVPAETVASGTWVLSYNKGASDKLSKTTKISESYTGFPKAIKAQLVKEVE